MDIFLCVAPVQVDVGDAHRLNVLCRVVCFESLVCRSVSLKLKCRMSSLLTGLSLPRLSSAPCFPPKPLTHSLWTDLWLHRHGISELNLGRSEYISYTGTESWLCPVVGCGWNGKGRWVS